MKECISRLKSGAWLTLLLAFSLWLPSGAATYPVSNLNDSGPGSFRDAIIQANATSTVVGSPHLIDIQVSGTLTLQSLLPTVFNYTNIQGPATGLFTLNGNVQFQVLKIADPNTLGDLVVNMSNLQILNGLGSGGGLFIDNATVNINNCQISQNLGSQNTGAGILINANSNVTMTNTTVNNNINSAGIGGGLAISGTGSSLNITNCTFSNNVSGVGGAIDVIVPATITINSSTIANNISQGNGGGIYLNAGTLTINNCLIANNNAQIVSDTGNDIRVNPDSTQDRIRSTQGFNLLSDSTGFLYHPTALTTGNIFVQPSSDIVDVSLSNNGGPVPTLALTPCSRAIDAGSPSAPATDQRGNARINTPDIGAFEYGALLVSDQQSCGASTITLTVSGGTSGATAYNWFDAATGGATLAQNTATLTLTNQAVTDTFYVAEAAACASPKRYRAIVTIFPVPQVPTISTNGLPTNVCSGGNLTLTAASATQPVTFEWFLGSNSVGTGNTLLATAAGSYTVTVTTDPSQGSCSRTSTATVLNFLPPPPAPVIQSALSGTPCDGDTVDLTTTAVENFYQWNLNGTPINGATNNSFQALSPGQYTLTVSSTLNCSTNSNAVTVTFNALPTAPVITPSGPLVFCAGNNVTLSSSYASGNTWSLSATPSVSLGNAQDFAVIQTGRYRVTHTDANGCRASADTTVTVNIPVVPSISASTPLTFCDGDSVRITSSASNFYNWLFNNVSSGLTTSSIRVTTSENVSVITTDLNGCSDTSNTITVTVNPVITPTIIPSGSTTLCQGQTVQLTSSVATGNVWSNGQTTQTITVSNSGTFVVAIPGCALPSLPTVVTVNPVPPAPIVSPGDTSFCEGTSVVFSATSSGGNLVWSDALSTTGNLLTVSAAGSYAISVTETNANGCSTTSDPVIAIVSPIPAAPQISPGGATTFCQGSNVTLTANQVSGVSWFEAGSPTSFSNSPSVIVSNSGNYFITYQDNNNCLSGQSNTIAVTVNVPVTPQIAASGPLTFCAGSSVDLSFTPAAVSNTWSLGNQTSPTINVNSTQTAVTVTTIDANNCSATSAPVDVTVNPIITPTVSSAAGSSFCAGDSLVLLSSSPTGNSWSLNGNPLSATTQNITVNTPGDYVVQITGCSSPSSPFTVTQNPLPAQPVVTSPNGLTACDGGSVTLQTNAVSNLYQWNVAGAGNADSAVVNAAGAYHVTVFNQFGCQSTSADVQVSFTPLPASPSVVSSAGNTICAGASAVLSASNYSSNLTWTLPDNSTSNTPTVTAAVTGVYSVVFTDPVSGCTSLPALFNLQVLASQQPQINVLGQTTFCDGGSVVLTSNLTSGFAWQGTPAPSDPTANSLTVTQSGTYTLLNTLCNQTSTPVVITVNPAPPVPVITPGQDTTICQGGSINLTSSASSGNSWSNGATSAAISVTAGGAYFVSVTDVNGCTAQSLPVNISIQNPPQVTLPDSINICGSSVTLNAANPGASYLWSGTGTTPADTLSQLTVTSSGFYFVTVTNSCGSATSDTSFVTLRPVPVIPLNDTSACTAPVILDAGNPGSTFLWSLNGQTTQQVVAQASGSYSVQVTNAQGCSATQTITVTINPGLPNINLGNAHTQCGGSYTLDAGNPGALSYQWNGPGVTSADSSQTLVVTQSGSYSVTVTNSCGSSSSQPVLVTIHPLPTLELGTPVAQCGGSLVLVSPTTANQYNWSGPGIVGSANNDSVTVNVSGTYSLTITDANNCTASDTKEVNLQSNLPQVALDSLISSCADSIQLDAGNAGSQYLWSGPGTTPADTNQTIYVHTTGAYFVTVTNGCGFTVSNPANVQFVDPGSVNLGNDVQQCGGTYVLNSGISGAASYVWTRNGQPFGGNTPDITVSQSGLYAVVVTVQQGCTSTDAVNVTLDASLPVVNLGGPYDTCATQITLVAGGPGNSYAWSNSNGALPDTTSSLLITQSGSYIAAVTNGCGTTTSNPALVSLNPVPVVQISDGSACNSAVVLDAGNPGASYLWTGPGTTTADTNQVLSVITAGLNTYTVVVTNAFGCSSSDNAQVLINTSLPVVNLVSDTVVCQATVTVNAGNDGNTYVWNDNGPSTSIRTFTQTGQYIVEVTNACGITRDTTNITIGQPFSVSINNGTDTIRACTAGGNNILLFAGSFNTGSTFSWSGPAFVFPSNSATAVVNTSGNYSVSITQDGCSASDNIFVSVSTAPPASVTLNDINQCGGTVTLDAGPGDANTTYAWSGAAGLPATQTISVGTGNYSVIVTNSCGSTNSNTAAVVVNPVPVVNLGNDTSACGGTIALDAGSFPAGTTFQWTGPSGFSSTNQAIVASASGNYSVTVTVSSAPGCSATDNINVNLQTNAPVVNLGGPITSCNSSETLDAGNPGMTYSWTGPGTLTNTQTNQVTQSGTYSVTVTNGCGVSATGSVLVTLVPAPTVDLGADTANCGAITLTAGNNASYSYAWTGPNGFTSTNASITAAQTGSYVVTVTAIGTTCTATDAIGVSISLNPPIIELGGPFSFCSNSTILNAGTFPVNTNFAWSTTDGSISGPVNTNLANVTQSGTYSVTVSNSCGSATDNVVITLLTPVSPSITASGPTTICQGNSVTLTASAGAASYLWIPGGQTTPSLTVTTAGAYACTITAANGCSATSPLTQVNVDSPVSAPVVTAAGPASFCQGGSVTLTSSASSNNVWSNNSTANSITVNLSGTYTVTVNQGACSATSAPFTVTVFPRPFALVSASGTQTLCKGDSVILSTGAFTSYQWFSVGSPPPDTQIGTAQSQTVKTAGNYYVVVTDANGCTARSFPNSNIVVNDTLPQPVITQTGVISACGGGSITFSVGNAFRYRWSTGETNNSITVTNAGTYYVDVFTNRGCKSTSDTIRLNVTPSQPLQVTLTKKSYPGNHGVSAFGKTDGEIYLDVTGGNQPFTFAWTDSTGNYTSTVEDPTGLRSGLYTVTVTDANGCTGTQTIRLTEPLDFKLPEGFSPNGDGKNDTFIIGSIELYPINNLKVYNRWGNIVYQKDNYANEWDGKSDNGTELPDGTYFIILDIPGLPLSKGYVELRR